MLRETVRLRQTRERGPSLLFHEKNKSPGKGLSRRSAAGILLPLRGALPAGTEDQDANEPLEHPGLPRSTGEARLAVITFRTRSSITCANRVRLEISFPGVEFGVLLWHGPGRLVRCGRQKNSFVSRLGTQRATARWLSPSSPPAPSGERRRNLEISRPNTIVTMQPTMLYQR